MFLNLDFCFVKAEKYIFYAIFSTVYKFMPVVNLAL